jgi:polyisoprenoid-binding protein YceI
MNQDLQAFLKVKEHPSASIRLIKVDISGDQIMNKPRQEAISLMEITLAGITKRYQIPVTITNDGGEYGFSGSLELNICDFDLEPPVVMMGLIRVKEEVKVDFKLKACIEKVIIH